MLWEWWNKSATMLNSAKGEEEEIGKTRFLASRLEVPKGGDRAVWHQEERECTVTT